MVADKQDGRFLPRCFQSTQQIADFVIKVRDIREVSASAANNVIARDVKTAPVVGIENTLGVRILLVIAKISNFRL